MNDIITESFFLDAKGNVTYLKDVISTEDCWYVEKEKRYVIAHRAIMKIARIAGISASYLVEESPTIQPSYKNDLQHIVRVTIKCNAKIGRRKGCQHDLYEDTLTITGEANRTNTAKQGKHYLRKMAEKRAFDIAVLEHLGLYDTTFSAEESETMTTGKTNTSSYQNTIEITNVELEALREEINIIMKIETSDDLVSATKLINDKTINKEYTDLKMQYLSMLLKDAQRKLDGEKPQENVLSELTPF